MAVTRVQANRASAYSATVTSTNLPVSLSTPATAGNLLVAVWGIDKNSGTITPPAGWTALANRAATSISILVAYKVAAGGETGATASWATGTLGSAANIAEYAGVDTSAPIGPTHFPAYSNTDQTNSITLNPAAATKAGAALAFIVQDSTDTTDGSGFQPASAGFTLLPVGFAGHIDAPAAALLEDLTIAAGEDIAPTFSWSIGDQKQGFIVLLNAAATATPATPALVSRMLGIPSDTGILASTRTTDATSVRAQVSTDQTFATGVISGAAVTPNAQGDSQLSVSGLAKGTTYWIRFGMTGSDGVETFSAVSSKSFTTDDPGVPGNFSFTFSSCDDAVDSTTFTTIAAHNADFFLHLGDWPHDTSATSYADGTGTTITNFRNQFTKKIQAPNHAALYATPMDFGPSDHDAYVNNSNAGTDATGWANFNAAVRELLPIGPFPGTQGVYKTWTRRRVRFIKLDRRSFASAPSATDNATKTSLGATQKQWLKDTVTNATERVIVIPQESPWIGAASAGDDGWAGYTTERTELANFFAASGKTIIMLAGDMHALAADDGTNAPGGIHVWHAAPFENGSSQKGGPYKVGPFPASGSTVVRQYGRVAVTDDGSTISLTFTGYASDGTTVLAPQTVNVSTGTAVTHTPADAAGATDAATASWAHSASATDTAGVADAVTATWQRARQVTDPVAVADSVGTSQGYLRGVNDAGGEFSHTTVPGVLDTDYHYDSAATFTYIAGRGHKIVRLPFLWERVQPTRGAALDPTLLANFVAYVKRATDAGLKVLLDMHNYARRHEGGVEKILGTDFPASDLVDVWTRLSAEFGANANVVGYGIMNEPHTLSGLSTTTGSELVTNPGFEVDLTGWGASGSTLTRSTTVFRSGVASMNVAATGATDARASFNGVPVAAGTTYAVGYDARGDASSVGKNSFVGIDWFDGVGGYLTSTFIDYFGLVDGTWQRHLVQVTAPAGAASANYIVGFQATAAGQQFWVDDVTWKAGTVTTGAKRWEQASQDVVTALRNAGDTTPIYVPGYEYSSAKNWATIHPEPWITDPAGATVYEAHFYFDRDNSGKYVNTYADENADAVARGYADLKARAVDELDNFTAWLTAKGVKGFVGEIGWPNTGDTAAWNAVGDALYTLLDQHKVGATYWSAGEWWHLTYLLSIYTGTPHDTPTSSAATVEAHPTPSTASGTSSSASDAIAVADAVTVRRGSAVSDAAGVTDATSSTLSASRSASDAVGVQDAASHSLGREATAGDTLGATDAAAVQRSTVAGGSDAVAASDAASLTRNASRDAADAAGVTDTVGVGRATNLGDAAGVADAVTVTRGQVRDATDSMAVADGAAVATSGSDAASFADTLAAADAITASWSRTQTAADSVSVSDGASTAASRSAADTAGVADAVAVAWQRQSGAADSVPVLDAASASASGILTTSASDAAAVGDAVSVSRDRVLAAEDAAGVADAVTVSRTRPVTAADVLPVGDAAVPGSGTTVAAADQIGTMDATTVSRGVGASPSDILSTADNVTLVFHRSVELADGLVLVDDLIDSRALQLWAADAIPVADLVGATQLSGRDITVQWGKAAYRTFVNGVILYRKFTGKITD